jgi:hypothetical protein
LASLGFTAARTLPVTPRLASSRFPRRGIISAIIPAAPEPAIGDNRFVLVVIFVVAEIVDPDEKI